MKIFKKKNYGVINISSIDNKYIPIVPDGAWVKCDYCGKILYKKDLENNYFICNNCGSNFRLSAYDRLRFTCDEGSFIEFNKNMESNNPMNFPGYEKKLNKNKNISALTEAVVTGKCLINGNAAMICIMDSHFMMGSMGTVVGEKITLAIEKAIEEKLPIIIFTASGGARMQEGIYSLMQMTKTSAALARHHQAGLLYISYITHPTTGGVTASFASLGDIIIGEPQALIGFAGRRVIESTLKQKLPENFQTTEFMEEQGFVDLIVKRQEMRSTLIRILKMHGKGA